MAIGEAPNGQLPYLEKDGEKTSESMAIAKKLAKEYGLYGDNDSEKKEIDTLLDKLGEMIDQLIAHKFEKDETKQREIWNKIIEKTLPETLTHIEKMIKQNKEAQTKETHDNKGFFIGKKVSVADLAIYTSFENILKQKEDLMDDYQHVRELREKVSKLPRIAKWLKDRPDTEI